MTGKTRIFISSTYYDLEEIREHMSENITALGHEAVLSEFSSFPVIPSLKAIENCKHNVRENSDIFILIIGQRRGSIDSVTDRSVTNLEYETAKQNGLDIFVFVKQEILDSLQKWKDHPNEDYSAIVDSTEVFRFTHNIQIDQQWILPFTTSNEISEIIKNQLSVRLKELLDRRKEGRLKPTYEFLRESLRAQQIVLDKPKYWEFLLQEELLRTKLTKIRKGYDDLKRGLVQNNSRYLTGTEYVQWLRMKITDFRNIIHLLGIAINEECHSAVGPPGVPGDPIAIQQAADKVANGCEKLLVWETELVFTSAPDDCLEAASLIKGITFPIVEKVSSIADKMSEIFRSIEIEPGREYTLNIKIDPIDWDPFAAKLDQLISKYFG